LQKQLSGMALGEKIVIARKKKGLTQEQLADLTNVTVRTIQRIESGESTPRSYTLKTLATVLDTGFEELIAADAEKKNTEDNPSNTSTIDSTGDDKHFLTLLCLSCYSFLVIPWVHFLIPVYLLKKAKNQNPTVIRFARRVIRFQIYWIVSLNCLLLATLAYNFVRAVYFQKTWLLHYWWPLFMMYFINTFIITVSLWRIKKMDFTYTKAA